MPGSKPTKNAQRRDRFVKLGQALSALKPSDAITVNDVNWRAAITPNPFAPMSSDEFNEHAWSRGLGNVVLQIDTKPGLARKKKPNE